MDLFSQTPPGKPPLAAVLRPTTLDDIIGQDALTAPGSILRRRIAAGHLGSIVLYGPPGVGKTSIARAVGAQMGKAFRQLHATRAGVKDIRALADEARAVPMLIFVDEVHRFSATQADDLLAICEDGVADFMGATTQNPFHSLPKALISRSQILPLEPLTVEAMERVIARGLTHLRAHGITIDLPGPLLAQIAGRSGGDARAALTILESLAVGHPEGHTTTITQAMIDEAYKAAPINFDRSGDAHYDTISAFIKSMRGSDPDATLYWLARLVHAGEDPRFIARRLMVHASEDVGLADNSVLQTAVAAAQAVEMVGYPEARIILAHAALHIARAPKSASAYRGIDLALAKVRNEAPLSIPFHLRDAHYKGAAELGHVGYRYPHDDPRGWVEQDYAPGVRPGDFYQSDARQSPTFEQRADSFWAQIKRLPIIRRF